MIYRVLILLFVCSSLHAKVAVDPKDPVYRSWLHYKNASNEFNTGNYEQALDNALKSNMFRPNKKSRKLVQKVREIGYSNVKTGVALVNFNPELAKDYLTKAKALIDPRDKKTMTLIEKTLISLEPAQ
jgi:hypothetical protein